MKNESDCSQFCDGCPISKYAEGSLGYNVQDSPPYMVTSMGEARIHIERKIRLIGENGGLSRSVRGKPKKYTREADAEHLLSAIGECDGPIIQERTVRIGFLFPKTYTEAEIACSGLSSYKNNNR